MRWSGPRTLFLGLFLAGILAAVPARSSEEPSSGSPHPDPAEFGDPACTDCHDDLLGGKVVHAAAEAGCDTCHTLSGSGDETTVNLQAVPEELCVMCHDNPAEVEGATSRHDPVAEAMCTACHSPHSSQRDHLLLGQGAVANDVCLECHVEVAEEIERPVVHGGVQSFGCIACHEPHASRFARLLRGEDNDLCLECHARAPGSRRIDDEGRVLLFGGRPVDAATFEALPKLALGGSRAGHPVAKHPVHAEHDPLRPERSFGCTSCHAPHASLRKGLLAGEAKGSFCVQCHRK
ncbi:MAG: cytochrome c3 family protein [Acidobacteriota bacterium]